MKTITVKGNEYKLEFGFDAAEHKNTVQKMFKVKSGAYMVEEGISVDGTPTASGIINGTASMVGDIPGIVKSAFYAGLLEHHDMPEEDAHELLKDYMRENKLTFRDVFMELTECMEISGISESNSNSSSGVLIFLEPVCNTSRLPLYMTIDDLPYKQP